jgi:hypothetical protein
LSFTAKPIPTWPWFASRRCVKATLSSNVTLGAGDVDVICVSYDAYSRCGEKMPTERPIRGVRRNTNETPEGTVVKFVAESGSWRVSHGRRVSTRPSISRMPSV